MTAKNAEGYPDPTAEEAIRHVMRGGKLDYTSFRTYEELQDYTIKHNKGINTREAADKFIREKMPKESYFQKKILDWIKDNAPNAIAWKEAAGPYSRQGIPDITCIINGRYYGFEVKRPFIGGTKQNTGADDKTDPQSRWQSMGSHFGKGSSRNPAAGTDTEIAREQTE